MTVEYGGLDISFTAGEDLSAKRYYLVKLNSSGEIELVDTAGEAAIGVLQDKPESGKAGLVRVNGVSKAVAGGTITAGQLLTSDDSGRVVAADNLAVASGATAVTSTAANGEILIGGATPQYVLGMALEAASAAGEIIAVKIF